MKSGSWRCPFQHRCFRKIHELKEAGKTILYVGHDTEAIRSLYDQAMILEGGRRMSIGESARVNNEYLAMIAEREQKYYEANLQEYGERPDPSWEVVYNLIGHLADAEKKMVHPEDIRELNIEVRPLPRNTIIGIFINFQSFYGSILPRILSSTDNSFLTQF
ncbi:MAG TPA: hypothetical protein VN372_14825 [Methanospirillum sp.]|nr:hypothetical protein [Methanospirillum sp.]